MTKQNEYFSLVITLTMDVAIIENCCHNFLGEAEVIEKSILIFGIILLPCYILLRLVI